MKQEKLIIIIEESLVSSIVKDIFTFILFGGLMYFNHRYLSGSTFIDFLFIVCVIMLLVGRASKSVFSGSKEKAIKWLKEGK